MTDLLELFDAVDRLNDSEKEQLKAYLNRQKQKSQPSVITFDLHPNAMTMSDDFDAELPDTFWFGKE